MVAGTGGALERFSRLVGFHIGRYDIRYASGKELRPGQYFQVVALNGVASEATKIYNAGNSNLWHEWRNIRAQPYCLRAD